MGNPGTGDSTVLAGDLYAALGWQLLAVVLLTGLVTLLVTFRRPVVAAGGARVVEPTGRRVLRISLGVLWLIDGLLQAQPAMPASFVRATIEPGLATAPDWLYAAVDPFVRLWVQHPVPADAITVWVQVGLGVAILVGGSGRLSRLVLIASAGWAGFVWFAGELVGGMTDPAASWLMGAPGAALLYVVASVLLLLPASTWRTGTAARLCRAGVGAVLFLGAVLQALPRGGYWSPDGLPQVLADTATGGVPAPLAAPVHWLATAVSSYTVPVNAVLVAVLAALAVGLLLNVFPRSMSVAAGVLCLLGWWLGQGFGIFGGTGTDPDTGIVLVVLLAAAWPWPVGDAPEVPEGELAAEGIGVSRLRVAGAILATGCLVALPMVLGAGLWGPQTAQAAVADSGGIVRTSPTPIPDFTLADQHGRAISTRDLRGKLVVVAFLDPECYEDCPLLANQLATAVRSLGSAQDSVALLAVDVNPVFNKVEDVATFTREHGLTDLAGWHFVTGSNAAIGSVLAAFGEGVTVPRVGMIGHPDDIFLFGRDGTGVGVLDDTANDDLTESYVELIASALRHQL